METSAKLEKCIIIFAKCVSGKVFANKFGKWFLIIWYLMTLSAVDYSKQLHWDMQDNYRF